MSFVIRKPGMLTTVQDLGRIGSRRFGINPNGAMDTAAVRAINIALGNDENAAVLEMHFPAAEVEFAQDTAFGIAGADFGAVLDGNRVSNWSTGNAKPGSVLKFARKELGHRAYLAVKGGIGVETWLKSRSTNLVAHIGGYEGRSAKAGDFVKCEESKMETTICLGPSFSNRYSGPRTLRIVTSGEFELLTALSEQTLTNGRFTLTNESNRMGFRLKGAPLYLLESRSLVSSATNFGTVQLLPNGQMVILMADHQTAGGYPRIGNVISADIPVAGQLGPGDKVMFKTVSIDEAENAFAQFKRDLNFLAMGCSLRRGIAS